MRFRLSLICLSLLIFGLSTFAQQAVRTSAGGVQHCLSAPAFPPQFHGVPKPKLTQACKPAASASAADRTNLTPFQDNATYVSFDYQGSLSGITASGMVVGYYSDAGGVVHGWLRNPDGSTMSFDDPLAVYATFALAVNDGGVVTGQYWDASQQFSGGHGYLGTPGGSYTTFDVPGDDGFDGTVGTAINAGGSVTGYYQDINNNTYGFLREPSGTITTFGLPGIFGVPVAINPRRQIAGWSLDANNVAHGFLRNQNGAMTTVDPPADTGITVGGFSPAGGNAISINSEGRIAGTYWQPIPGNPLGGNQQGFVRHTDGSFEEFVSASYGPCCIWTWATGISPDGTVVGYENDGYNENHGYLRRRDGTVTLFDEPDAGTGEFQGTFPIAISTNGVVLGVYFDSNNALHGFLRMPPQ